MSNGFYDRGILLMVSDHYLLFSSRDELEMGDEMHFFRLLCTSMYLQTGFCDVLGFLGPRRINNLPVFRA